VTEGGVDVHPLREEEFEAVCSHLPGRSRAHHRSRLDEQHAGRFVYLIAWIDGVPAGHVGIGFPDDRRVADRCEWGDRALVSDLWVEPAFRGRGAGRALMVELERRCREAGVEEIGLDSGVHDGYAAARNLYRSLGYTDRGGAFVSSETMPPGAGLPYFIEILTIWTKSLRD
jgi:ribosomal protein S18 acetylase RimI-like enzyme